MEELTPAMGQAGPPAFFVSFSCSFMEGGITMKIFLILYFSIGSFFCALSMLLATINIVRATHKLSLGIVILMYLVCLLEIAIWPIEVFVSKVNGIIESVRK